MIKNIISSLPKFSYGRFVIENRKTNPTLRRKALKLFLEKTR